eukprot:tig00001001_g6197.t1
MNPCRNALESAIRSAGAEDPAGCAWPRHWLSAGCDCDLAKIRRKQGGWRRRRVCCGGAGALGAALDPAHPVTSAATIQARPAPAPAPPPAPPRPGPATRPRPRPRPSLNL